MPPRCLDGLQILGRVWILSQEACGCRQVQQAFECAPTDEIREAMALELYGHVLEACKCPHANHVLQKMILLMPAKSCQFILDELMAGPLTQMFRHKYGCRIVQRLVEYCHPDQVHDLAERVLSELPVLACHPFGTYVAQNLLQHGPEDARIRAGKAVMQSIRVLGSESHGCAVVSAAMTHSMDSERCALSSVLLREPGLLVFLAASRHGHEAALGALGCLSGQEREDARSRLRSESAALRQSRYGRAVLDKLEQIESDTSEQMLLSAACRAGA